METDALSLVLSGDPELVAIVRLSLLVSLTATVMAALLAVPFGTALATCRFPGCDAVVVLLNALMGLPPVLVGLAVFLTLSRSGPLGGLGLLFTPWAMILAQAVLIFPIIAALTRQSIEAIWAEYSDELRAMQLSALRRALTLVFEARFALATILLAGFGRAAAEVGAVMIVGGNIDGYTRVMTTSIALETSKGNLALAVGLGVVLIILITLINALTWGLKKWAERHAG